jgi:hypothetical protein
MILDFPDTSLPGGDKGGRGHIKHRVPCPILDLQIQISMPEPMYVHF